MSGVPCSCNLGDGHEDIIIRIIVLLSRGWMIRLNKIEELFDIVELDCGCALMVLPPALATVET